MKNKVEGAVTGFAGLILFLWFLPILLIIGVFSFLYWLIFKLPVRGKKKREFASKVLKLRENKRAYLVYDRNHNFSEWLEEYFIPNYSDQLIVKKYTTDDLDVDEDLLSEIANKSKDGELEPGVNTLDCCSDYQELGSLFVLGSDGSVTRWMPIVRGDSDVIDIEKTKELFERVIKDAS
ncbi:hypothetical protein CR969_01780 [Candidatus Saccharibacteria bacterium]|nr:MAG: hypothetical protein CR969_01780 [Candidatus Saccharibacteria bacterium]